MSIVKRINLVMGAMIALILFAGGFAVFQSTKLSASFSDFKEISTTAEVADAMASGMVEARVAELKYRSTGNTATADRLIGSLDEIRTNNLVLTSRLEGSELQTTMSDASEQLQSYRTEIERMIVIKTELNVGLAELHTLATQARQNLSEAATIAFDANETNLGRRLAESNVNLLLGRSYFERYRQTNQPEDFDRAKLEIESALQKMSWLEGAVTGTETGTFVANATTSLQAFSDLYRDLSTKLKTEISKHEVLDILGPNTLAKLTEISKALEDRSVQTGETGAEVARFAIIVVSAIVALGVIIGAALAFLTGRGIALSLNTATHTMRTIADGDLDIDISHSDAETEVAQINNALVIFRDNARTALDLDAEMKRKQETERARETAAQEERIRQEEEKSAAQERAHAKEQAQLQVLVAFQKEVEEVLNAAASGNFSNRMPTDQADPSLKGLSMVINRLLEATESNISDLMQSIGQLSGGNLATRVEGERSGAFQRMQEDFNGAMDAVVGTMATVMQSSQSVSGTASELESSSLGMAKRAETSAASLEETSAAVEEITASIRQVVASAKSAEDATMRVRDSAYKTQEASNETEASINQMTEASTEINRVINVIEDIAFQINLLALNAGVEAARAGEAGRGFSVVASEVRALAQRSKDAVQEINEVIQRNNKTVEEGVTKVIQSRTAVEGIISEVEVVTGQISEIALAVEQQSHGIEEVNTAIQSIDTASQVNAATLEEMTAASASLSGESRALDSALGHFQLTNQGKAPSSTTENQDIAV